MNVPDDGLMTRFVMRPSVVWCRVGAVFLLACLSALAQLTARPSMQLSMPYAAAAAMLAVAMIGIRARGRSSAFSVLLWSGALGMATLIYVVPRTAIDGTALLQGLPVLVATAVAEESLFRDQLPLGLSRGRHQQRDFQMPPTRQAIVVSQLVFALIHLPTFAVPVVQFHLSVSAIATELIAAFVFGCLMSAARRSGAGLGMRAAYHTFVNVLGLAVPIAPLAGASRLIGITAAFAIVFATLSRLEISYRAAKRTTPALMKRAHSGR